MLYVSTYLTFFLGCLLWKLFPLIVVTFAQISPASWSPNKTLVLVCITELSCSVSPFLVVNELRVCHHPVASTSSKVFWEIITIYLLCIIYVFKSFPTSLNNLFLPMFSVRLHNWLFLLSIKCFIKSLLLTESSKRHSEKLLENLKYIF